MLGVAYPINTGKKMSKIDTGGKNLNEFVYKGAIVRPYEPFHEHYSERFFSGSVGGVSPTI